MTFNSVEYAVFLPAVLLAYWAMRHRSQNALLLAASYLFYGWWDARFLTLLALSTVVDYSTGRLLGRIDDERRRRGLLLISLGVNLGILGFFKYWGFFVGSANDFLRATGIFKPDLATLRVLLPVGISFYTFQTLSYTIDVYRRRIEPTDDLLTFAVYVAFFPQLVAGPIERASHLLPQFEAPRRRPDGEETRSALFLIGLGLAKKIAIADALAPTVQAAFSNAGSASWLTLLAGAYAFALQIYGDFSGYTDIARGSARLLGIDLMENFRQPYLSRNVTEFWRRWHISLSTWLRDYLYIPLGGNRGSKRATVRNLMTTMLLGGLWHGAAWTFVVWGGLHGAALAAHRPFRDRAATDSAPLRARDTWTILGTFHLVCLGWIFFRAQGFHQAFDFLVGILTLRGGVVDLDAWSIVVPAALVMFAIDFVQRRAEDETIFLRWPSPARGAVYGCMALAILVFMGGTPVPFIYFRF